MTTAERKRWQGSHKELILHYMFVWSIKLHMRHTRGAGDLNEMCTRGKAEAPGGLDRQFKIILLIGSRWALSSY